MFYQTGQNLDLSGDPLTLPGCAPTPAVASCVLVLTRIICPVLYLGMVASVSTVDCR